MKTKALCITALFSLLSLTSACAYSKQNAPAEAQSEQSAPSIEGRVWAGKDSDGDYYEYHFAKGGQLNYKVTRNDGSANSYTDKSDVWAQNNEYVLFMINDYSSYLGIIKGNVIQGKAWNKKGLTWTWTAELVPQENK